MFFFSTVIVADILPALLAAGLVFVAHHWSRTPRALHAWSRAMNILGAQCVLVAALMALVLIAIFSYPDLSDPRPIPLTAYVAALLWCVGPALTGIALRAAARGLQRKADRTVTMREVQAFS